MACGLSRWNWYEGNRSPRSSKPPGGHDEFRERLEREAKAIAAINHPNIVTIHSVEDCGGVRFITMELVRGKSLAALIQAAGWP